MLRVKICGVRTADDLQACLAAGADAIGFNFWPQSKRYLAPEQAAPLIKQLPPAVLPIGVFVGASPEEVAAAVRVSGVRAAQLHGGEDPAPYLALPVAIIPVVRMRDRSSLPSGPADPRVEVVLLDAHVEGFGGAGRQFDWSLVPEARRRLARPVLLAGGLTPENVGEAVCSARPWGVDVASGVESAPGIKDPAKVCAFVQAARAAASEVDG